MFSIAKPFGNSNYGVYAKDCIREYDGYAASDGACRKKYYEKNNRNLPDVD